MRKALDAASNSLAADLRALEKAVAVAERHKERLGFEQQEIDSRRQFILQQQQQLETLDADVKVIHPRQTQTLNPKPLTLESNRQVGPLIGGCARGFSTSCKSGFRRLVITVKGLGFGVQSLGFRVWECLLVWSQSASAAAAAQQSLPLGPSGSGDFFGVEIQQQQAVRNLLKPAAAAAAV